MLFALTSIAGWLAICAVCAPYDPREVDWNLNTNQQTTNPLEYSGEWKNHKFTPSPENWRFPFYTLMLDRFVNGDPTNDDINGTVFEHDVTSNQLRFGGDLAGLVDSLDYLQGMGIKGLYIAGTPFLNLPYKYDAYSPIDFTILDHHLGTIGDWQTAIDEIHRRDMYVLLDTTGSTLADLIGFEGYPNQTATFSEGEHKVFWKSNTTYPDFTFGNDYNENCEYPRFWNASGHRVLKELVTGLDQNFSKLVGCYNSDFDQYGDIEAFGSHPDWQRQLAKFASVQDRLRDWKPSVREKIEHMMCLTISQLDIDGFRFDKATQMTVDAQAELAASLRTCARKYNKKNFFLPGEITGGNDFGSIYLGRGREPEMRPNYTDLPNITSEDTKYFLRNDSLQSLDAAAFHYSIYRTLTTFLGMDGNNSAGYDVPLNFVDTWNSMLISNDFLNANDRNFDPRHMYGASNQDVFRWPAIKDGTDRMLLALFITTLHMPGIPLLNYGEEQAFYVLDSTANNYLFGRQPMASNSAWQIHGCYMLNSSQYYHWPADAALYGCNDSSVSLDHRDPTHPVRNIIKSMNALREQYPVLQDGFGLQALTNQTHQIFLPGSNGSAMEVGMWSVARSRLDDLQDLDSGNQSVWLVYQNEDHKVPYKFNCSNNETGLLAPFAEGTTVKNLLFPYEEIELEDGPGKKFFIDKSQKINGCLKELSLDAWGFKAFVPKSAWEPPRPMLTAFVPGHDARIQAPSPDLDIELHFSDALDCDDVTKTLKINATTQDNVLPKVDESTVKCEKIAHTDVPAHGVYVPSSWRWKAKLTGITDGTHMLTLDMSFNDANTENTTGTVDHLMFRVGKDNNPLVFNQTAQKASNIYSRDPNTNELRVTHEAAGANRWRYSTNWGSSWSAWMDYKGGTDTVAELPWSGTRRQRWSGDHIILQYWSKMAGSSDHVVHADTDWSKKVLPRFPHLFAHGKFNLFGYDGGLQNTFQQDALTGVSRFHLSTEWTEQPPTQVQLNVWGMNPDEEPDQTFVYGDMDGDGILDRALPGALSPPMLNLSNLPPSPYLAWAVHLDEPKLRYELVPAGNRHVQLIVYTLLWLLPIASAALAIWIYMGAFYKIKFNQIGNPMKGKASILGMFKARRGGFSRLEDEDYNAGLRPLELGVLPSQQAASSTGIATAPKPVRRCILIATMEYDIEDWAIKIKIGGLGVMAQLMGKALGGHDLIWVVPCVGGVDYPVDQVAEPMVVTIMEQQFDIQVQYHQLRNITYVLLDAPIFRQQSKSEPYPPRMDDLDSAIYYSAWNACIARTTERFPIDIYHINDYHGAAAPLYLLPKTIPCCLSLHNAEFQGLWPMRTKQEQEEICKAFNLSQKIVEKYVQFGGVFNLLHAGASYLRVHQGGFGAVGVSNKYGSRSLARYPIFWALKEIGKLPNPDPSDTEPWDEEAEAKQVITVDPAFEAARGDLRKQAQEWAGLDINPRANLFVFVGRWSVQKGVDLIADVFPAVLEKHKDVQLICVGPIIDLYGKFAALKLEAIMKKYPKRVFSKPEFTQLPPYIHSGAEFALIPSRDEPFGLVAVEFGRKGALGVGARVGGLGQMPGWWYTVESTTSKHLIQQFKSAIDDALSSSTPVRADMRARSAKQRFPVARWVEDLETLHSASIRIHNSGARSGTNTPKRRSVATNSFGLLSSFGEDSRNASTDRLSSYAAPASEQQARDVGGIAQSGGLGRTLSLGKRTGPGYSKASARVNRLSRFEEEGIEDEAEVEITNEEAEAEYRTENVSAALRSLEGREPERAIVPQTIGLAVSDEDNSRGRSRLQQPLFALSAPGSTEALPISPTVGMRDISRSRSRSPSAQVQPMLLPGDTRPSHKRHSSLLSLAEVTGGRRDYSLQKVDLDFTDKQNEYYKKFEHLLQEKLTAKSSESTLVIEDYLKKSEKEWNARYRAEKLRRPRSASPAGSRHRYSSARPSFDIGRDSPALSQGNSSRSSHENNAYDAGSQMDEFLLGNDYVRPTILKRWLQIRIFDWPIYCILLALGQIMAANSYQIVLLTGGSGAGLATKLYVVGVIYIIASCLWWLLFRTKTPRYVTSVPFALYGLSFIFVGVAPLVAKGGRRHWVGNIATGFYATASASGSLYFALNFGDEGGAPIQHWVYRASIVQGIQQLYVCALFYFGRVMSDTMNELTNTGKPVETIIDKPILAAIAMPIGAVLLAIGALLYTSLPSYYRQMPGKIPYFYQSLFRRKLIIWMFVSVILQNYFLSAPYGRSWSYLWSSTYAPKWVIGVMALIFFVGVWVVLLLVFAQLSKSHSWILPMFAFGLLAPRWAQMWWGTSSYGLWLPWMPGGPVGGAIAGRSLWLWLGVLDSIQGVGIGMALLQTLTRIHVAVVLTASQILGAAVTLIAKASAPDKDGPGPVFPDLSAGVATGLAQPWFWVALLCQLAIPIGFFFFFRKEQMSKP